jgi:hypothetical protein
MRRGGHSFYCPMLKGAGTGLELMGMALEILGVALWLVFALAGAWLLVTGRDMFFGMPLGFSDVRLRRLFGLVWVLAGAFFSVRVAQGSVSWWSVIALYAGVASSYVFSWWKAREARA